MDCTKNIYEAIRRKTTETEGFNEEVRTTGSAKHSVFNAIVATAASTESISRHIA